jgi:coenzyme F420-0:L-glutamate ligase / coenzyme F420-1:gamma-L-glutamate ligase
LISKKIEKILQPTEQKLGHRPLTLTPLPDFPLVKAGDDLGDLILTSLESAGITLKDGDILVSAQKVVSKAEGRLVDLTTVEPSPRALQLAGEVDKDPRFVELVLRESREVLRTRPGTLIVEHRLGFVCANAGIDHSNVQGPYGEPEDWVLLLPADPGGSADRLRKQFCERSGANVGVLIIDSHGRAWRDGVVGISIGFAGLPGVIDMRGKPDLFGFKLRITKIAAVDELAAAASLVMGQADEACPVVHVRGFPYPLRDGNLSEVLRPKDQDLFR